MNGISRFWVSTNLSVKIGFVVGSISILLSVISGEIAGNLAKKRIELKIGNELSHFARQMSYTLDQNLFERYREIQIIAAMEPFRDPYANDLTRQALLNKLQSTYPSYSWIGFTNQQGIVQSSTQGLLEGKSVSERDWFIQAQQKPYVGDVHEAVLLAKLLPNPQGAPLRFVDVATPVYNDQGEFQGVLGAHLSWQWAEEVKTLLFDTPAVARKEIFVVDKTGTVLLGPEQWQGETLALESLRLAQTQPEGSVVERWPDGRLYLVGFIRSQGYRDYPGLGWTILVHEPTATAFAPARSLSWQILGIGMALGSGFAVVGWIWAKRITEPLVHIAHTADQIRQGNREVMLPNLEGKSEIAKLSQTLTQLIADLLERESDLSTANTDLKMQLDANKSISQSLSRSEEQLRQIVDGIDDMIVLREASTGKTIYANVGLAAAYSESEMTTNQDKSYLQPVYTDDKAWVSKNFESDSEGKTICNSKYRTIDDEGNIRWFWERTFPIRDETGTVYRYVDIKRDITEIKQTAEVLQTLMLGTASATGKAFFEELVRHLAKALHAEHVFITEKAGQDLQTLAFWSREELQANIAYSPKNTPCQTILQDGSYYCRNHVDQEFPGNPYLLALNARGYVGVALTSLTGSILGTLCVICENPLQDRTQYMTILQIFSHRAAAELERQRSETALQQSEVRFRLIAENVKDLVCLHDLSGQFLYLSPSCKSLLGFEPDELAGSNPYENCHPNDRVRTRLHMQKSIRDGDSSPVVYRARHRYGHYVWLESLIKVIYSAQGEPAYLQTSSRDITEKVQAQQKLEYSATHDSLTGLANRSLSVERLDLAIARARRYDDFQFAVLYVDLDRFKVINDSLGHLAGDRLLQLAARRLSNVIRGIDIAARIGGDEFVLLIEELNGLQDAICVAERILADFKTAISLDTREVVIGVSIGIVLATNNYTQSLDLLRDADIAMYAAKNKGRSCYVIFDQTMHERALQRLEIENALRQALEQKEFTLCYQPIVNLSTGKLAGYEALVRWQHPERGMISPADFIPIAEDTGLIVPLGKWILQEACRQMSQWQTQFTTAANLKISVNLSVKQLREADLITQVEQILQETGLNGRNLTLEITESMLMEDIEAVNQCLQKLNKLSIQISIDDFGTGFSSLSYLHRLSVNNLKIDRSFIINLFKSRRNLDIAETIIKLSDQLGLNTIAEGIETQEQLHQLKAFGCILGQGYLFNAPVNSEVAETLIAQLSK